MVNSGHNVESGGSCATMNITKTGDPSYGTEGKDGADSLMLRRTQGELLQKLRQLRQWQQQQQEHLLQNKEKKLSFIREQEKRLQAVQDYQEKILTQSGNIGHSPHVNLTTVRNLTGGNPSFHMKTFGHGFHEIPDERPPLALQQGDFNQNFNLKSSSNLGSAGLMPPTPKAVLLSPKHFQTAVSHVEEDLDTKNSPDTLASTRSNNPMLLTQKVHLPPVSDEEFSQFTESDSNSIGDIDGIRPIEDSASEASLDDDKVSDLHSLNELNEDNFEHVEEGSDENDTLVEDERQELTCLKNEDPGVNTEPSFDDIPIKPGIGPQTKTFEQLLEEQLQAELKKEPEKQNGHQAALAVKRTFLRKGEGIARFGLKGKKGNVERKPLKETEKDNANKAEVQNGPVTRKIAANKQSAVISQERPSQAYNLNQKKQMITSEKQLSSCVIRPYTSIEVALDRNMENNSDNEADSSTDGGRRTPRRAPVIEDSFQERMKKWDEMDMVEKQELNEFELLEEAAFNCSLSSNSSTVLRILGKKKVQAEVDRNNNMSWVLRERKPNGKDSRIFLENGSLVEERLNQMERHQISDDMENDNGVDKDIGVDNDLNNTLTEEKTEDEGEDTLKPGDIISVQSSLAPSDGFDDSKTWEDQDALEPSLGRDELIISLNTSTPEDKSHTRRSRDPSGRSPHASSTPPTSALVTKLFPQLKNGNDVPKAIDSEQHAKRRQSPKHDTLRGNKPSPSATVSVNTVDSTNARDSLENVMSSAVREKLQELEKEIEKFREENATLHKLREEREKELQELKQERSLFEKHKSEELERLEKYKVEEERRLRREKRVFEQYQKASRALPDKKEREEIAALKSKISEQQEDMKLRESRWSAAATRYKDRIASLEKENKEMKEEVKLLQKQNLELQRKDQQNTRELQQFKAFEKRKLTKPEELKAKSVLSRGPSQTASGKEEERENFAKEHEKAQTPQSSPPEVHEQPKEQAKVASEIRAPRTELKESSAKEDYGTRERPSPQNIPQILKPRVIEARNETVESTTTTTKLKEPSPPAPAKKASSSKSVRFKDDDSKEDRLTQQTSKEICHNDGKREVLNSDGSRVVTFSNGTRKEISGDGLSVIVTFYNGDVKQVMPDQRVVYYYAEAQTTHTTYPDGMEVLHFPSNQIEKHYPDGTKEIIFPDQTVKYLYQSGAEECVFSDGTVERISGDGDRIVEFPNGQRETYTKLFKKREYPDGTVKTVYSDGRQETRYPSGRLRVKDGEGRLLVDTADQNN